MPKERTEDNLVMENENWLQREGRTGREQGTADKRAERQKEQGGSAMQRPLNSAASTDESCHWLCEAQY